MTNRRGLRARRRWAKWRNKARNEWLRSARELDMIEELGETPPIGLWAMMIRREGGSLRKRL